MGRLSNLQFGPALQGMDVYSNILYVKEDFAGLSNMAHRMTETDKYRPQSVCIVGNYYSLKGQHEKVCSDCQREGLAQCIICNQMQLMCNVWHAALAALQ